MNALIDSYAGRPVVFVEHNVDVPTDASDKRRSRWYDASGLSSATLPLIMTDSGYRWTQSSQPRGFDVVYTEMIEAALARPPMVTIEAWARRWGLQSALRVRGRVTNISSQTLGYDNVATLHVIAFEPVQVIHTKSTVRKAVSVEINPDLEPGGTYDFDLKLSDLAGRVNMSRLKVVVLVDYKPDPTQRPFVSANAALAQPDTQPLPTETEPPTPAPTAVPTVAPTAAPSYLPLAKRHS